MICNSLDPGMPRLATGVPNLDAIFWGGIPSGSVFVLVGQPGTGKTILAERICVHNATRDKSVLYFTTLSEPPAKALRYLARFRFFDPAKLDNALRFVDLGSTLRFKGLEPTKMRGTDHSANQHEFVIGDQGLQVHTPRLTIYRSAPGGAAIEEGTRRQRYLEVYTLRNTAHVMGRHKMRIGADGIKVFPRFDPEAPAMAAESGREKT